MRRRIWILMNMYGKPVRDDKEQLLAFPDKKEAQKECDRWNKLPTKETLQVAKAYIEFKKSWKVT